MVNDHLYLPSQPTSFVGRESEVAEIVGLLKDQHCRLLTLVGPGGIGKTRLGIEVADRFVNPKTDTDPVNLFPDGVYLVTLQSVASVSNIIPTIASAIGFEFYEARNPDRQLIDHIGDKQLLLILDNLEHLLDAGDLISELLSGVSQLKLLATSREPLNLREEWLYHVEGMPFPKSDNEAMTHRESPHSRRDRYANEEYDAIRLFVERARRLRHNYSIDDDLACVVRLCQLVEGMPLAIELAAAWLKSLSCNEIVTEIQCNLDILETDMRGVPNRHRSMRAVFDYSWQLLNQVERDLFMMLSVFRGGFQREAAEQIAGASLKTLSALVDKSMVVSQSNGRYQLHELQRQYGAEQLGKASNVETAVRNRHCEYFAALMDRPFRDYWGHRSIETLKAIDADFDNVQAAWYWAVAQGRYSDLRKCIFGLLPYWYLRWHRGVEKAYHDGLIALRSAEPSPERDVTLGCALANQSHVDLWMGRQQYAREQAEESIDILEPLDAQRELSQAFGARARVSCWVQGRDPEEAKALTLKAAALFEETGQYELLGLMYTMLGGLKYDIGQLEESEQWYQKDLELSRRIDDPLGETRALANLGRHALVLGSYGKAGQLLLESLKIARVLKNRSWINEALNRLGLVAMAVGDLETAERYFLECVASAKEWGKPYSIAYSFINLADLNVARKEYKLATDLYQETRAYSEGIRMIQADRLLGLGRIAFEEGEYAEAQGLHKESLRICEENGYRLQKAKNNDALGRITMAKSLVLETKSHFRVALQESVTIGAPPVILESIISIGELVAHEGDRKEASELATLVMNHPASRAESKERATRLLRQIESDMSVEDVEAMGKTVAQDDLESVAAKLLAWLTIDQESTDHANVATSHLVLDPLSERELELLRLVAEGSSNREIAGELTLALGTVKSHLHNIYQKLDASSRTQAIVRARELDLL
ncbi:MAG: tetratricopeptide repeat protein [Candidatus Promineifilaceae bacterium]